jgi:hypothetical protein
MTTIPGLRSCQGEGDSLVNLYLSGCTGKSSTTSHKGVGDNCLEAMPAMKLAKEKVEGVISKSLRILLANLFLRLQSRDFRRGAPRLCAFRGVMGEATCRCFRVRQQYLFVSCEPSQVFVWQRVNLLAPEISPILRESHYRRRRLCVLARQTRRAF